MRFFELYLLSVKCHKTLIEKYLEKAQKTQSLVLNEFRYILQNSLIAYSPCLYLEELKIEKNRLLLEKELVEFQRLLNRIPCQMALNLIFQTVRHWIDLREQRQTQDENDAK